MMIRCLRTELQKNVSRHGYYGYSFRFLIHVLTPASFYRARRCMCPARRSMTYRPFHDSAAGPDSSEPTKVRTSRFAASWALSGTQGRALSKNIGDWPHVGRPIERGKYFRPCVGCGVDMLLPSHVGPTANRVSWYNYGACVRGICCRLIDA